MLISEILSYKHRLLQVQPISRYCCAGCRLVPQTAEQHLEIAVGYRLSVIPWENRVQCKCRGVLLRCRESRWSRLWVMCGKSWKVGHEWHALHWNSEATNRGARFHLALRRPLVFRSLQVRDHPERPRWLRGGLDILTGIQWLSRQDVLCTVYKNLSSWACCFAAKKGWW